MMSLFANAIDMRTSNTAYIARFSLCYLGVIAEVLQHRRPSPLLFAACNKNGYRNECVGIHMVYLAMLYVVMSYVSTKTDFP